MGRRMVRVYMNVQRLLITNFTVLEMQEKVDEARFLLNSLSYEVFSFSMSLRPYVLNEVVVYHAVEQWMDRLFVSARDNNRLSQLIP